VQLSSIGVPNEEGYRRELREFLFTAPGVSDCISGVVRALLAQPAFICKRRPADACVQGRALQSLGCRKCWRI